MMYLRVLTRILCLTLLFLASSPAFAGDNTGIDAWASDQVDQALKGGLDVVDFQHIGPALRYRQDFTDYSLVDQLLAQLVASPKIDPLIEAEVLRWKAQILSEEGHSKRSKALFQQLGGLSRWWALGPKNFEELDAFDSVAKLPAADASWREINGTGVGGWLRLEGMAWPARRQMLYLGCTIESQKEQAVAIRLGLAQVGRVWLNGEPLLTSDYPLRAAADQLSVGSWLKKGENELIIAVASEDADWWLRVRLSKPDGSGLPGIRELNQPPTGRRVALSRKHVKIRSLESELEKAVAHSKKGADVALAALLTDRSAGPRNSGAARDACLRAKPSDPVLVGLDKLRLNLKDSEERDTLYELLEAGAPAVPARLRLARWLASRNFIRQAHALLSPFGHEASVHVAKLELDAQRWGPVALPEMLRVAEENPRCLRVLKTVASRCKSLDRGLDAEKLALQAGKIAPMRKEILSLNRDLASGCGKAEVVSNSLQAVLDSDPNRPATRIRLARAISSEGDGARAHQLIEEGLRRCPGNVDMLLESAHLDHRFGRDTAAAATAHRVLELRPQNVRAQRLLGLLGKESIQEDWRRRMNELRPLVDQAQDLPGPAVLLLDHQEVRFLPGKLSEERVQRLFLIRDAQHSAGLKTTSIAYVPERQNLRILAARIIRSGGSEINARRSDTPRLSDPAVNMYYDTRLKLLSFEELKDGDLIEISYLLSETAEANETGAYEGGILRLGSPSPTLKAEMELAGPKEALPKWELANLKGSVRESIDEEGWTHLRWSFSRLKALPHDVPPGPSLWTRPYLAYSNHPGWSQLGQWYARHVAPRIRPTRRIEEKAREVVGDAHDRREKIARIYRFVTTQIHYVGLEFGEHRFRPFSSDWVLTHEMGDCKDTAGLLVSLFSSLKIPARMVMIRTADQGPVSSKLAVLEDFNHAIAYLPEDDLWLDGTASGHVVYPPPGVDQNAWAMVVDETGSAPKTTPILGAGNTHMLYTLHQEEDASVRVHLRLEATGEAGTIQRAKFGGSENPLLFSRWFQSQFPGIELVGAPKTSLRPGKDPATIELEGRGKEGRVFASGALHIYPGNFRLDEIFAPGEDRQDPLILAVSPDLDWTLKIEAAGRDINLGAPVDLQSPFGRLRLDIEEIKGGRQIHGSFHLKPGLVSAADYPALRAFLVKVRALLEDSVEVS